MVLQYNIVHCTNWMNLLNCRLAWVWVLLLMMMIWKRDLLIRSNLCHHRDMNSIMNMNTNIALCKAIVMGIPWYDDWLRSYVSHLFCLSVSHFFPLNTLSQFTNLYSYHFFLRDFIILVLFCQMNQHGGGVMTTVNTLAIFWGTSWTTNDGKNKIAGMFDSSLQSTPAHSQGILYHKNNSSYSDLGVVSVCTIIYLWYSIEFFVVDVSCRFGCFSQRL